MSIIDEIKESFRKGSTLTRLIYINLAVFILVSLLTKPESDETVEEYFDKMQRLSDAEISKKDGKKPLAGEFGKELILLDFPSWFRKERWQNFSSRYREDWRGFIYAWGFVGLLVLIAWAVIQL